jgi:hypothetical protein
MRFRPTTPLLARRGDQRGQVLVLFTLTLVVLLLISALAVDYGGWLVTRRSYQNVADAAALAGASQLTRPLTDACTGSVSKNQCARQAAWQSVKSALGLTILDPVSQAASSSTKTSAYTENGYSIWVASPPAEANAGCSSECPFPGHVSGPGDVFVKVEHPGAHYLSRILFASDVPVTAWATAGRFPENFAVIGLCNPDAGDRCLTGQGANIQVDGNGSFLAVDTGDIGTNGWTKTNGNGSVIGLGSDSNAYMQDFDTCWGFATNQCQLAGYSGGAVDYSVTRSATALGAPVSDPAYAAPTVNGTTVPNQCKGAGTVQLASLVETGPQAPSTNTTTADGSDLTLAAAQLPATPTPIQLGASKPTITGTVKNSSGTALSGINISTSPGNFTDTTGAAGGYSLKNVTTNTTYTITATDPSGIYHGGQVTQAVATSDVVAPLITLQKNPVISGTIRDANTNALLSGVSITVTSVTFGTTWTGTTNSSGAYSIIPTVSDTFTVSGSKTGYITSSGNSTGGVVAYDGTATVSFALTPAPASLTGTITDSVTGLPIPYITVTLTPGGYSATTDASGTYTIASMSQGTYTATLTGTNVGSLPAGTMWGTGTTLDGFLTGSPSTPATPLASLSVAGATTQNFSLWPKGCSNNSRNYGSWDCGYPSGSNCPATTNANASTVNCTETQANAIRPGTYDDISIDGCAWIDPRGGVEGLPTGQSPGIVHIKGSLSMSNDSYLFGDGVTLVLDQGASVSVGNGGGFVLNFGSQVVGGSCDYSTIKEYNDGSTPCFRSVSDGKDYAYGAWTTKGNSPWACSGTPASPPSYDTSSPCVSVGKDLGITWYLYGTPSGGSGHRFNISTANMGYLFNGVLYGPHDDIALGGGKDGQSAAGQIVGWTIEYHGGTKIVQRWYGDPVDGPPFLVEPVLGECFAPVASC